MAGQLLEPVFSSFKVQNFTSKALRFGENSSVILQSFKKVSRMRKYLKWIHEIQPSTTNILIYDVLLVKIINIWIKFES